MIIVGLDRARYKHDYLMMTPTGEILQRGRIPHNAAGLQELAATIEHHAGADHDIRVGIEMNDGTLLAWLIEKGYTVLGIQPKSARRKEKGPELFIVARACFLRFAWLLSGAPRAAPHSAKRLGLWLRRLKETT